MGSNLNEDSHSTSDILDFEFSSLLGFDRLFDRPDVSLEANIADSLNKCGGEGPPQANGCSTLCRGAAGRSDVAGS